MKNLLLLLIVFLPVSVAHAQDTIVLNSGSEIIGYIVSTDSVEVKYTIQKNEKFILSVPLIYVFKICYEKGNVMNYNLDFCAERDTLFYRNALKTGPFSPLFSHFYLSWEKVLGRNVTFELFAGGIVDNTMHVKTYSPLYGVYARLGGRYYLTKTKLIKSNKPFSTMYGHYVGLMLNYTYFEYMNPSLYADDALVFVPLFLERIYQHSFSFHGVLGVQIPITNGIVLNPSIGLGYTCSIDNGVTYYNEASFEYSYLRPFNSNFTVTTMLQIGYVF